MPTPTVSRRRRVFKILRLFFSLVAGFLLQYAWARVRGRRYDFFGDTRHNRRRAIAIRETALQMGGVLIKVGQFVSSRVDLLPKEYIEELALLQDEVPGVPFDQIRVIVEREFKRPLAEVFQSFDTDPIAAASLGQVHRAQLTEGQQVAVKIQRPDIVDVVEADLAAFRYIVGWLERHTSIGRRADLQLILQEFEETLRLELDYEQEAHHAERMSFTLAAYRDVVVPRVFWSHTRPKVLTMQYVTGTKVTDFAELGLHHINSSVVAEILLRAYLLQIIRHGFFHADPHPGNLLVRPGPQVVLLDFGMMGDISPGMRDDLRHIFLGVVRREYDAVLAALDRLGFVPANADLLVLRRAIAWTVETFYDMSFADLQAVDPNLVLDRFQEVIQTESLRIPANFAFLGRALGTLSGICTALDPTLQFVNVAEPFARDLLQRRRGLSGTVAQISDEARSLAAAAYSIPYLTRGALERVQKGELDFHRELDEVVRAVDGVERGLRRLVFGLLVGAFLIVGALVFPTHYRIFSIGAFLVSLLLFLVAMSPSRRRSRP